MYVASFEIYHAWFKESDVPIQIANGCENESQFAKKKPSTCNNVFQELNKTTNLKIICTELKRLNFDKKASFPTENENLLWSRTA